MKIFSTTALKGQEFRGEESSPSCVAVLTSSPGPVVMKRQKKDSVPQSVFTIPPELDVSLLLEFVG